MTRPRFVETSGDDFERRTAAARRRAAWELGDDTWAGIILAAFLDPDEDDDALRREQGEAKR